MTFEIIKGNLFDPELNFDGIAQGVNCQGIMGAGIAVAFRDNFPLMYEEYRELCHTVDSRILAGHVQVTGSDTLKALIDGEDPLPAVFNMFTQVMPGANADYGLLERAAFLLDQTLEHNFNSVNDTLICATLGDDIPLCAAKKYVVGLPWIGCGIGGLARHNVEEILRNQLESSVFNYVLVEQ